MAHVHSWQPVPLRVARYSCSCGVFGRRHRGEIVAYANGRLPRDYFDAIEESQSVARHPGTRHVSALPSEPYATAYDGAWIEPKGAV